MSKEEHSSSLNRWDTESHSTVFTDVKLLVKAGVLIANVLPVFTGFWLALYFTGSSLNDHWGLLLLTLIGSTLIMAGALVINNWYDADIDKVMKRTQNRPTVTGHIPLKIVLTIGIAATVLGLVLLLFTTVEAVIYALVGWFTYVVLYTMWSKRKYTLNTVIGSVSGAVTPLIGWAAVEPSLSIVPVMLFLLLFIWQVPHTFAIAIRKCEEYKAAGVPMLPVVYGFEMTKRQIAVYVTCLLPIPFFLTSLGWPFVIISTLLNLVWLVISFRGLFTKNDIEWARFVFLYSVNYIAILFLLMVVVTLPVFG